MMVNMKQFGFTLIELLITIALFSVLASLAIPSYQAMIQNNRTRNAAESIQGGLQIARAEAVKRNTLVQFDLRGVNSAWTVCTSPTPAGSCPVVDDSTTVQSRSIGEGSSTDISVSVSDAGPYVFNSLGVMTSPTPAGSKLTIDIDNTALDSSDSRDLRIEIGAGGSVKVCDPALSASGTDPRRCS